MVSTRSWRSKGFRIAELTREELEAAIKGSYNYNQLIRILGFADGDIARINLKQRIIELSIDVSHFKQSKRIITSEHIVKERREKSNRKIRAKYSLQRKNPAHRAKFILQDAKRADKKVGCGEFQLSLQEIQNIIQNPCLYCGETKLMMTLDRIDNTKGHIKDNVNPSCIRCNIFRRDMPYEAWLEIVPFLRKVREDGEFGEWTGGRELIHGFVDEQDEPLIAPPEDGHHEKT